MAAPPAATTDSKNTQFDVFISYSHKDTAWVKSDLIPKLESWKIRYAIDYKDFVAGKSVNSEMARLIKASRHTLIVLTPNWLGSNFTDFEAQLRWALDREGREQRVLLLRRDECNPPDLYRGLTLVDLARLGPPAWENLRRALVAEVIRVSPFHVKLTFAREYDMEGETGYSYACSLDIAAVLGSPLAFDAVVFRPHYPAIAPPSPRAARVVGMGFTQRGMVMVFGYDDDAMPTIGGANYETNEPEPAEVITLEPGHGMRIPHLRMGPLGASVPGRCPIPLSVHLQNAGRRISDNAWCVLPPISRLPQADSGKNAEVTLMPDRWLSPASGILNHDLLRTIFATANEFARDHLLVNISPHMVSVNEMMDGQILHLVSSWRYWFYSEEVAGQFYIDPNDPTWIDTNDVSQTKEKPQGWLDENLLASCGLDFNMAYLVGMQAGCVGKKDGKAGSSLQVLKLDGRWRPLWRVPLYYRDAPAGVLADTGELVAQTNQDWSKPKFVMWNA
jgi:hypothetical protein